MGLSSRTSWMMGRCDLLPKCFQNLNKESVPWVGIASSLIIGIIMLFGGPSWQKIVGFLTATSMIALAIGPISLIALRLQLPKVSRPFHLMGAPIVCRLAFVMTTWAILWSGREAIIGSIAVVVIPTILFLIPRGMRGGSLDLRNGLWWILYLGGILAILFMIDTRGWYPLPLKEQMIISAIFSLIVFSIAVASRLKLVSPEAPLEFHE
jgi:amino acid transporter